MSLPRIIPLLIVAVCIAVGVVRAAPALAVPANDDFPGEAITAIPASITGDTTGATVQPDEPSSDCFGSGLQHTAWWSISYPETTVVELTVETFGAWTPLVNIWGPSEFPGGGLSAVACGGYPSWPDEPINDVANTYFQVAAGVTLYIQLGGDDFFDVSDDEGPFEMTIELVDPPANDDIAAAISVGALPFSHEVELEGATSEPDEPESGCFGFGGLLPFGNASAWYSFTATQREIIAVEAAADEEFFSYATIAVWAGTPGDLTEVSCAVYVTGFETVPGTTYYAQIGLLPYYGFPEEESGPIHVSFERVPFPECPGGAGQVFTDPTNDLVEPEWLGAAGTIPVGELKQIRVVGGVETTCITVQLAGPLPTGLPVEGDYTEIHVLLDLDSRAFTGSGYSPEYLCGSTNPLPSIGVEARFVVSPGDNNRVVEIYQEVFPGEEDAVGVVTQAGDSITIALPTDFLGRDGQQNVVAYSLTYAEDGFAVDCIPNTGKLVVSQVVSPRFGDLDCDVASVRATSSQSWRTRTKCLSRRATALPWVN